MTLATALTTQAQHQRRALPRAHQTTRFLITNDCQCIGAFELTQSGLKGLHQVACIV